MFYFNVNLTGNNKINFREFHLFRLISESEFIFLANIAKDFHFADRDILSAEVSFNDAKRFLNLTNEPKEKTINKINEVFYRFQRMDLVRSFEYSESQDEFYCWLSESVYFIAYEIKYGINIRDIKPILLGNSKWFQKVDFSFLPLSFTPNIIPEHLIGLAEEKSSLSEVQYFFDRSLEGARSAIYQKKEAFSFSEYIINSLHDFIYTGDCFGRFFMAQRDSKMRDEVLDFLGVQKRT